MSDLPDLLSALEGATEHGVVVDVVPLLKVLYKAAKKRREECTAQLPVILAQCGWWAAQMSALLVSVRNAIASEELWAAELPREGEERLFDDVALTEKQELLETVHYWWVVLRTLCANPEAQALLLADTELLHTAVFIPLRAVLSFTHKRSRGAPQRVDDDGWMAWALDCACSGLKLCSNLMAGNQAARGLVWEEVCVRGAARDSLFHADTEVFQYGCAVLYNAALGEDDKDGGDTDTNRWKTICSTETKEATTSLLYEALDREASLSMMLLSRTLASPALFGFGMSSSPEHQDLQQERKGVGEGAAEEEEEEEESSASLEWVEFLVLEVFLHVPNACAEVLRTCKSSSQPSSSSREITNVTVWSEPVVMLLLVALQRTVRTDADLTSEAVRACVLGNLCTLVDALTNGLSMIEAEEEGGERTRGRVTAWLKCCMMLFGIVGTCGIACEEDNVWLGALDSNSEFALLAVKCVQVCYESKYGFHDAMAFPQTGSDNHAADVTAKKPGNVYSSPRGLKTAVMRVICATAFRNDQFQTKWGQCGGLIACMNHTRIDENNPYIREWAVFGIKNLTEGHMDNQRIVHEVRVPNEVVPAPELDKMGVQAKLDKDTGKVRIGNNKNPP
jgi:hypothetical protein